MTRGDVVLVRVPHPSGLRGKRRPAVVVQADAYAALRTVVIAEVTTNLSMATDPACLHIAAGTPEAQQAGLLQESVVTCLVLNTVYAHSIDQTLGTLPSPLLARLDGCLRAALGLP